MEKLIVKEFNSVQVKQKYLTTVLGNQEYITGSGESNINNAWESISDNIKHFSLIMQEDAV
jgi:hypothetical protein